MQRQILINVMVFFAYALNLPLNTQRPHHRSQRAGKLGLDFGSWQSPDISRSHLYRGTFPWTPPTAIYRAYTVLITYWSTMSQITAWCLMAPSHYLNQCWLEITGIHPTAQIFFPVIFSTSSLFLFSCYFFSCYFFSCYFFSVTFFPVTFFPTIDGTKPLPEPMLTYHH